MDEIIENSEELINNIQDDVIIQELQKSEDDIKQVELFIFQSSKKSFG